LIELLWRREYIDSELPKNKLPNDKATREIAKSIDQFKNEPSELELMMKILGVEVSFTPKAYCEIAGRGVEYLFGMSKLLFRKENVLLDNNKWVNGLENRVKNIFTSIPLASI